MGSAYEDLEAKASLCFAMGLGSKTTREFTFGVNSDKSVDVLSCPCNVDKY